MAGRLRTSGLLALVLGGCGPAAGGPSDTTDATSTSESISSSGTTTSLSTSTTTTTTTPSTTVTATGDDPTGCLDGCRGCPWESCLEGEYCTDDMECEPIPEELPACADRRWVVDPVAIDIAVPAVDLTFVDVDGIGGRELVLTDALGNLEILTPMLEPFATATLAQSVTRIAGTDFGLDGFGDLLVRTADGDVLGFAGDGAGNFTIVAELGVVGGAEQTAFGDWNADDRSDAAVLVDDGIAVQIRAPETIDGGLSAGSAHELGTIATALVGVARPQATYDDILAALADRSLLLVTRNRVGGVLELETESTSAAVLLDLAGFAGFAPGFAGVGTAEGGTVLELFDDGLDSRAVWPLPQIGSPRRIAAFADPWSFDTDMLLVLGDAPTMLLVVAPWHAVPCVVEFEAGPGVSVALGYTFPIVATEAAVLERLHFP